MEEGSRHENLGWMMGEDGFSLRLTKVIHLGQSQKFELRGTTLPLTVCGGLTFTTT